MNYIVLDLEWNQSNTGEEPEITDLPFEIVDIGAVKLDENGNEIGEFNELVKPVVYREMHHITGKLIHLKMEDLENARDFSRVAEDFLAWCGENYVFCTWGSGDLLELQRNMNFHRMKALSDGPIAYLDVQKLFSIEYEDRKTRRALEYAIDYLKIDKGIPFHRAFSDASYTAEIFRVIFHKDREVLKNVSYDIFQPPKDRKSEIKVQFDTYFKYISRPFADKKAAFADREVNSCKCYLCHRNLRKRIKWFSINSKYYYCVAYCDKHGYLRGKLRFHKTENGKVYAVKITKFITTEEVEAITEKKVRAKELRRKHGTKESRDYDHQ